MTRRQWNFLCSFGYVTTAAFCVHNHRYEFAVMTGWLSLVFLAIASQEP